MLKGLSLYPQLFLAFIPGMTDDWVPDRVLHAPTGIPAGSGGSPGCDPDCRSGSPALRLPQGRRGGEGVFTSNAASAATLRRRQTGTDYRHLRLVANTYNRERSVQLQTDCVFRHDARDRERFFRFQFDHTTNILRLISLIIRSS